MRVEGHRCPTEAEVAAAGLCLRAQLTVTHVGTHTGREPI